METGEDTYYCNKVLLLKLDSKLNSSHILQYIDYNDTAAIVHSYHGDETAFFKILVETVPAFKLQVSEWTFPMAAAD